MIFLIELIEGKQDEIRIKYINDVIACELRGGSALSISLTYDSLKRHSEQRADDYISGVVAGINHCAITGQAPKVANFDEH